MSDPDLGDALPSILRGRARDSSFRERFSFGVILARGQRWAVSTSLTRLR